MILRRRALFAMWEARSTSPSATPCELAAVAFTTVHVDGWKQVVAELDDGRLHVFFLRVVGCVNERPTVWSSSMNPARSCCHRKKGDQRDHRRVEQMQHRFVERKGLPRGCREGREAREMRKEPQRVQLRGNWRQELMVHGGRQKSGKARWKEAETFLPKDGRNLRMQVVDKRRARRGKRGNGRCQRGVV